MIHARQKTALIVGATGSFGGHAAAALIKHGWRVRALTRDVAAARAKSGPRMPIEWTRGNAMSATQVTAAAAGADVIVHAANPPGYRNWRGLAAPMLAATIAAARATGARIVFPGNVYNYAPGAGPCIAEAAPQAPVTRKGRIRVRMEAMLREAACDGVRVLIVRSGDFFGPAAPTSGLGWLTSRRGGRVRCVYAPGPGEVGHAWAYLPDLAEARRGCWIARPTWPASRLSTSPAIGWRAARRWRPRSAASPRAPTCRSGPSPGP